MTENKVWVVDAMHDEDTWGTRVCICGSYNKAKVYIENQYKYAKKACDEYDSITEMETYHRNTCDQFSWCVNKEVTSYFITCEAVL